MRIQGSVTAVSWIPSEGMTGPYRLPMDLGIGHYDDPPPETVDGAGLERLVAEDRCRFANELQGWIEVQDGRVVDHGRDGGMHLGATTLRMGRLARTITAVAFPDLRPPPEVHEDRVTFTQTVGCRTGAPLPRPVPRPPWFQYAAPTAWTTLSLTLHADGRRESALVGASPFPRHWVYDDAGVLAAKSGVMDFTEWHRKWFGLHSPWGDQDSPALVTAVETALERELSRSIMRDGATPRRRRLDVGDTLVAQGDEGDELFLLLDGVLAVEVDGEELGHVGPGAILGERALLEGGRRTSTLRAATRCLVAVTDPDHVRRDTLLDVAAGHRRELAEP